MGRVVKRLNSDRFEYMLTGAIASSYYGQPRTTMDVDVVLRLRGKGISRLLASLAKAGLEVDREKARIGLKAGFRILTFKDTHTPHSVDIILSGHKLRRRLGSIIGIPTYYQTPEELILTKLRMIKATIDPERVMKDRQDVKSIIRFTKTQIERIREEAKRESTLDILEDLLRLNPSPNQS